MASSAHDSDDEITGINVTPLVDVMLVLLIIFMVTASYISNQSINVNLPKADTGQDAAQTTNLAFVLDKDSNLFLDGQKLEFAALPDMIKQRSAANPKVQAIIAADQATPHGIVIKLIDTIRKNGITDFAINVEAGQ
jgi:biopolymer transport protein ExbD